METRKITGGLYLVVAPDNGAAKLLSKVEAALEGGVDVLQLLNQWPKDMSEKDKAVFIQSICSLAHRFDVPVLIHEEWEWLRSTELDGVHFESVPAQWQSLKEDLNRPFITGLTCTNDPTRIQWAVEHELDYISFCSMFPSASAGQCEIIDHDTVLNTSRMTSMPIFASGGITPENCKSLIPLGIHGIAVISGILKAADPKAAAESYKHALVNAKPTLL